MQRSLSLIYSRFCWYIYKCVIPRQYNTHIFVEITVFHINIPIDDGYYMCAMIVYMISVIIKILINK